MENSRQGVGGHTPVYVPVCALVGSGFSKPWPPAVWPEFQWDTEQLCINYRLSIMHLFRVAWASQPWGAAVEKVGRVHPREGSSDWPGQEGPPAPQSSEGCFPGPV